MIWKKELKKYVKTIKLILKLKKWNKKQKKNINQLNHLINQQTDIKAIRIHLHMKVQQIITKLYKKKNQISSRTFDSNTIQIQYYIIFFYINIAGKKKDKENNNNSEEKEEIKETEEKKNENKSYTIHSIKKKFYPEYWMKFNCNVIQM